MTTTQPAQPRHIDSAAVAHFAAKLRFETDPSDVHAEMLGAAPWFVLDSRGEAAWSQGRLPGAVHLPTAQIEERRRRARPGAPGRDLLLGSGLQRVDPVGLTLSRLGYDVRELVGGFEYWAREGVPVVTDAGTSRGGVDPLTGPIGSASCDC